MRLRDSLDRSDFNIPGTHNAKDMDLYDNERINAKWETILRDNADAERYIRDVVYTNNSQGYRSLEWNHYDWSKTTAWFGCSEVYGIAAPDEDVITNIYTELTGNPAANFGVAGASPGHVEELINDVLSQVKPRAVVIGWPPHDRLWIKYKGLGYNMSPWNYSDKKRFFGKHVPGCWEYCRKMYKNAIQDSTLLEYKTMDNIVKRVTNAINIPCVQYHSVDKKTAQWLEQTWWEKMNWQDLATDGAHSNGRRNRRIVKQLLYHHPILA
jgi:hypothetical protein